MWIFTTVGFFSVVQKPNETFLTVRARVAADLDRLREKYMPELSETTSRGGTDYPCRATIGHEDFARGVTKLARDIHYSNFKNEDQSKMGNKREQVYSKVWSVLKQLERLPEDER